MRIGRAPIYAADIVHDWWGIRRLRRRSWSRLISLLSSVLPALAVRLVVFFVFFYYMVVCQMSVHPITWRIVVAFRCILFSLIVMLGEFVGTVFSHSSPFILLPFPIGKGGTARGSGAFSSTMSLLSSLSVRSTISATIGSDKRSIINVETDRGCRLHAHLLLPILVC